MNTQTEYEIDLLDILKYLKTKIWIMSIVLIVTLVAAFSVNSFLIDPLYVSQSKIYVINRQSSEYTSVNDLNSANYLAKDYQHMIVDALVLNEVIDELNLDITLKQLQNSITVTNPTNTRFLEINVTNHSPELAKKIADAICKISSRQIMEIMGVEEVNQVGEGNLPVQPSSPAVLKNTVLAGAISVFVTALIFAVIHIMNDKIYTPSDVEKYLEISVLGVVPRSNNLQRASKKTKPETIEA